MVTVLVPMNLSDLEMCDTVSQFYRCFYCLTQNDQISMAAWGTAWLSQAAPAPQFLETPTYTRCNKVVIKLDEKKILTGSAAPGMAKNFVTQMLTCDLFAVARLVVSGITKLLHMSDSVITADVDRQLKWCKLEYSLDYTHSRAIYVWLQVWGKITVHVCNMHPLFTWPQFWLKIEHVTVEILQY